MSAVEIPCEPSVTTFQEVHSAALVVPLGLLHEEGMRLMHCTRAKHAVEALNFEDKTLAENIG